VIESFRHKRLKKLYENDDSRGVLSEHLPKLRNILARLDAAASIEDLNLPGFRLHPLKKDLKGY
jgi:toxin HigB-1